MNQVHMSGVSMYSEEFLTKLSAIEVAKGIETRVVDPIRYIDCLLRRLEETASLGGLISIQADELRRASADLDSIYATPRSPLRAIPLIIKDNIDVAGMVTTAGSAALRGVIATRNAPLVDRLLSAGALVLGKASMHEFAVGITNNNGSFGPARNPIDPTRIPGGSSGGCATVIASFAAPAGIGTDTGGSIRIPAALCGIVGFRPSVGRWPAQGTVPISQTMDTAGPMARTVADCALLDAVVSSDDQELRDVPLASLRIGVPRKHFWHDLDAEMLSAGEEVLTLLRQHGVTLVECDVAGVAELSAGSKQVALFELLPAVKEYFRIHGLPFEPQEFLSLVGSPDVRATFELLMTNSPVTQASYEHAINVLRPGLQYAYASCFSDHRLDAILFPTTPLAATLIGEDETVTLNGRQAPTFPTFVRNTSPSAFAGLPGISLPMRRTKAGLPQGIELDGAFGSDRHLLAVANSVEAMLRRLVAA